MCDTRLRPARGSCFTELVWSTGQSLDYWRLSGTVWACGWPQGQVAWVSGCCESCFPMG